MKSLIASASLLLALTACGVPSSGKNTFNGANENYACTTSTGQIELKATSTPLPECVKLSDLPPEDAQLIADAAAAAAAKPAPVPVTPGSIAVNPAGL